MDTEPETETAPSPARHRSRRFWDRVRGSLALVLAVTALIGTAAQLVAWTSGKVGIVVTGTPERFASLDSLILTKTAYADTVHRDLARIDSLFDRRLVVQEVKTDMLLALACTNTPDRDLRLTRLRDVCSSTLDRWRTPGDRR